MLTTDFGKGGAERVFGQLSHQLAKNNTVIDCVFNRLESCEYVSGNEIVDLNVPPGSNWFWKAAYFFLRVYRLRQIKHKYAIDMTISHLEGADYVNILTRTSDKVILCIHGTKLHDKNIRGFLGVLRSKVLIPVLYKRATHIVCVSGAIRRELIEHFKIAPERTSVINNFFDIEAIKKMAQERVPDDFHVLMRDYDVVITSGRLVPEKNHTLLIRLMPALLESRPRIRLVILGSGSLLHRLVEDAQNVGLAVQLPDQPFSAENKVFFLGFCQNPFSLIRRAKVFAFPSLWEGFPLALCEALICQVPVVAHDCPSGPREIIAPGLGDLQTLMELKISDSGILVPFSENSDESTLRRWEVAILKVLDDHLLREKFIENGQRRVQAFAKERIMMQWEETVNRYLMEQPISDGVQRSQA